MQISDMLAQYNRSSATGATATAPQQGVQQLVSAVREMTVGNVFEGTVNDIKNGTVTLGLANGQTVQARIAAGVQLAVGQAMFFQVKSNDGTTVEIRPYTNGNLNNPTLLKALDAAGIPAEPRMIDMVNSMMEEQMSIGRESLMDMARSISAYPDADIKSLVLMHKLDIPMSEEFIRQFENYVGILLGYQPEACDQRGICGIQNVVEADGSVYPCDFYMLDEYRLGNFNANQMEEINAKRKEIGFIERSLQLKESCKSCPYFTICRGGCQRNRDYDQVSGMYENYFCKSYEMFFDACLPKMKEMAETLKRR